MTKQNKARFIPADEWLSQQRKRFIPADEWLNDYSPKPTQSHNHDIAEPIETEEVEQYWKDFEKECDYEYKRLSCPNCGDFYPYVLEGKCDCGYNSEQNDHSSEHLAEIIAQTRKDIADDNFLSKCSHYMELLKVNRQEFDDYLIYEFDVEELLGTDNEDLLYDMEVKVNEVKVIARLVSLYSRQHLNKIEEAVILHHEGVKAFINKYNDVQVIQAFHFQATNRFLIFCKDLKVKKKHKEEYCVYWWDWANRITTKSGDYIDCYFKYRLLINVNTHQPMQLALALGV